MSNKILNFCAVVTALTGLSVLNISSAALAQNRISGDSRATVTSEPRGVNRVFTGESNANASGPKSATTNTNAGLTSTPTTAGTNASASSQAGSKLKGSSNVDSSITGTGTGPTDLKITAKNQTRAGVEGARNGNANAVSGSSIGPGGGFAGGFGSYTGGR